MTYQETENYIFDKLPMFQNIGGKAYKPTLDNTKILCAHLGNPQKKLKFIHVAGTNGKGSVSHSLASIWQEAGYKVGLFTSPHLKTYRERIRINGEMISEQDVIYLVETLKNQIETISPSFFEATTAMAFKYFADNNVDLVVLEVGMGGRLDATNIITPLVSVITNISYDHQKFLGDTLPQIAGEKAGIIKPNVPVVVGEYHPDTFMVFLEKATQENAPLYKAWENFEVIETQNTNFQYDNLITLKNIGENRDKNIDFLQEITFLPSLKGNYQQNNFITIAQTVSLLAKDWHISPEILKKGLENVTNYTHIKGRWQTISENPLVICDTAHNEGGFRKLFEQFEQIITRRNIQKIVLILGFAQDKDYIKVLESIQDFFYSKKIEISYYFTTFPLQRALSEQILAQNAKEKLDISSLTFPSVENALTFAQKETKETSAKDTENTKNTLIFIGGSNFIVAEIPNL